MARAAERDTSTRFTRLGTLCLAMSCAAERDTTLTRSIRLSSVSGDARVVPGLAVRRRELVVTLFYEVHRPMLYFPLSPFLSPFHNWVQ